jgi:hypothetical protein
MRLELSAEYENEQARMRQWLAVRAPTPAPGAADARATIPALADSETARGVARDSAEWRLVPDRDTLVDSASGTAAHPTVVLRPGEARAPVFDNSSDQTAALRSERLGALSRSPPRRPRFRKFALAGASLAFGAIAGAAYLRFNVREPAISLSNPAKKQFVREGREPPLPLRVAETSLALVAEAASITPVTPAMIAPREPRLRIVSDPVGADITLSGRKLGRAPLTTDPLSPDTDYELGASLNGYQSVRRVVRTTTDVSDVTLFLLKRR